MTSPWCGWSGPPGERVRDDASGTLPKPQLTVRGWLACVLTTMGLLVLLGAVVGGVLLDRTDEVSRSLRDDIQPSRVSAAQLQSALRDQETGLRGYLISADRQFLSPYYDGMRAEQAASQDIRQRLGGRADLIADLDAIETTAANWRRRLCRATHRAA